MGFNLEKALEAGYKGFPGTMEKIPRKDWIIKRGQ